MAVPKIVRQGWSIAPAASLPTFLRMGRTLLVNLAERLERSGRINSLPPKPLTVEGMQKLFSSLFVHGIQNLRDKAILEILYACGLRKQELANLNLGDVDFSEGIVHVRGKGDKERLVPIHEQVLKSIADYLAARGGKPKGNSPLFISHHRPDGKVERISASGIDKIFRKVNKHSEKHIHPHLIRHCFTLHLLQGETDLRYVQLLLSHESPDTTSRYLGFCKGEIKREYDRGIDWILSSE